MLSKPKWPGVYPPAPNNGALLLPCPPEQNYIKNQFITGRLLDLGKQFEALVRHLAGPVRLSTLITPVVDAAGLEACIRDLLNGTYIMVHFVSEYRFSYRGFVSWMMLANSNDCFAIDIMTLGLQASNLRRVFEEYKIVKLVYNLPTVSACLAKDFNIHLMNVFNLSALENQYQQLSQTRQQYQQYYYEQILAASEIITRRPAQPPMRKLLDKSLELLHDFTLKMPQQLQCSGFAASSVLDHLLGLYLYANESTPTYYYYTQQVTPALADSEVQDLQAKERKLYHSLLQFREHMAKRCDVNVEMVMPRGVMVRILGHCRMSVLEISQLYQECGCGNVGLELCKRIYDIIQLNQQLYQDETRLNEYFLEKEIKNYESGYKKQRPETNTTIKQLLKEIEWGDSSQWLNRKDDPSIKLYKQIISIDEFDYSIGEEYINMMKDNILSKKDIGRFLKYGQYMRNKNYDKLEALYKSTLVENHNERSDQFEEETEFGTDGTEQKWSRRLFDDQPHYRKSSTSLEQHIVRSTVVLPDDQVKSQFLRNQASTGVCNVEQSEPASRKASESSSLHITELEQMCLKRSDIRPLPNSIEQIYELALQVKKRTDKKVNKKKDKKGRAETNRDMEFVPTWQDIQDLIKRTNNLK